MLDMIYFFDYDSFTGENLVSTELATQTKDAQIAPMMQMMQQAVAAGNVEMLKELYAFQRQIDADEARKAFDRDFAAFKAESIRISRNITVNDGPLKGKKYADLFAVVDALIPALSRFRFSHKWEITRDEPEWIEVTCEIRHELGVSERVPMGGPPDKGGAKNAIQSRASTVTYLQRYTLLAAVGMASMGQDNDGAGAGQSLEDIRYMDLMGAIDSAANRVDLQKAFGAAWTEAKAIKDSVSQRKFQEAYDARKKEVA
jgi:hypothetical protein